MRYFLPFAALLVSVFVYSQEAYYSSPVRIPMILSGSFAELRSNHFHSGIDIKTQGTVNIPVYAVADGFISRISISPTGYGNVIYIEHDNGTTSVYGHLNWFRPDIEEYIRNIQYERKSFQVDVTVLPEIFPIKKNEKFALSGNSGSSDGPHLHFEIRNTKTSDPLNPLKFGFNVADKSAPKIYALQITPLSESSHVNYNTGKVIFEVVQADGKYQLKNNPVIPVYGEIGFAIEANDFLDGSANKCGINSMELMIDDAVYSSFELNRFSFNQSKYINSYIDYEEYSLSSRRFQRTWIEPCSKLSNFEFTEKNGVFDPGIGAVHPVKIEIKDSDGNTSVLEFSVEGKYREIQPKLKEYVAEFECGRVNQFKTEDFIIELTEDALYNNLRFQYQSKEATNGFYSDICEIHNKNVPLHQPAVVGIKTKNLKEQFQQKALLVNINPETGKYTAAGGNYENGWVAAEINRFGNYAVRIDTVPPAILPLSITNKNTLTEANRIRFEITDDLAGIENIEGLIDGIWALFEYDAKNNRITHYFDAERFELNKQHNLKLTVTDKKGNNSVYEATFQK